VTEDPKGLTPEFERLALEERRRQGSEHPSMELLGAYRQRTLGPTEVEAIQDHLAVCPRCVEALLELRRFQEMMEADEPEIPEESSPSPADTEASWQALRARLAPRLSDSPSIPEPPAAREGRVVEASSRFRRWTTSPPLFLALAAALLFCLIGFPLWIFSRPPATPLVIVQPGAFEITRGEGDSRRAISVALGDATAVLSLPLPPRPSFASYRIEIRTLDGEPRLTVTPSLVPSASRPGIATPSPGSPAPRRLVAFALPQGSLSPGEYRLRLVGLDGAREEALAEHRLRILNP
jgi:Putative zinc-finger